jgi:hypothetical protein
VRHHRLTHYAARFIPGALTNICGFRSISEALTPPGVKANVTYQISTIGRFQKVGTGSRGLRVSSAQRRRLRANQIEPLFRRSRLLEASRLLVSSSGGHLASLIIVWCRTLLCGTTFEF